MQNFMPGTQPRGTYSFDPSSSSAQSVLDKVNAEEDGAEDQDGPPLDLSHANIAGAFFIQPRHPGAWSPTIQAIVVPFLILWWH